MKNSLISIFICIFLFGCNTNQVKKDNWAAEKNAVLSKYNQISEYSSFKTLIDQNKIYSKEQGNKFEVLASRSYPSEIDKPLLLEYAKYFEAYTTDLIEVDRRYVSNIGQERIHLRETFLDTRIMLLSDLYNGELTFSEYEEKRSNIVNHFKATDQKMVSLMKQQSQTAKDKRKALAIEARKAAALEAQARAQQQKNTIDLLMPKSITCTTTGAFTTCR